MTFLCTSPEVTIALFLIFFLAGLLCGWIAFAPIGDKQ